MRLGIDLGGTKIEGIAIDDKGSEKFRKRVATPRGDYEKTLAAIGSLVHEMESTLKLPPTPVGIGAPGAISPVTGLVKNSNSTWLIGRPLDRDLEKFLERPVRIANDANCFTLSEATDGAGREKDVVFGVILGTGVGGGIVAHGKILGGANAIAGEWGHNPLPWPKPDELDIEICYCGKRGCIESFLSGPGVARDHLKITGERLTAPEIVEKSSAGDKQARDTLTRFDDRLARSLAHVINILDPSVIVMGGGLSNLDRIYKNVPAIWSRYVFSDEVRTPLVKNIHGDSGGVRGAAWLF
jgi:fructokinase